jgi:hypothetical protein
MTRLELLHAIQENADQLSTHDAFALLASRLPSDPAVYEAWHQLSLALIAERAA